MLTPVPQPATTLITSAILSMMMAGCDSATEASVDYGPFEAPENYNAPGKAHYLAKTEAFLEPAAAEGAILFVGDSLTERFRPGDVFAGCKTENLGIERDETSGLLKRLVQIELRDAPGQIVLLIGANDVMRGRSADDTVANLDAISRRLGDYAEEVVIVSVLPQTQERDAAIDALNKVLGELAERDGHTFVNAYDALALNGAESDPAYFHDGVHMNKDGYRIYSDLLRPHLIEEACQ